MESSSRTPCRSPDPTLRTIVLTLAGCMAPRDKISWKGWLYCHQSVHAHMHALLYVCVCFVETLIHLVLCYHSRFSELPLDGSVVCYSAWSWYMITITPHRSAQECIKYTAQLKLGLCFMYLIIYMVLYILSYSVLYFSQRERVQILQRSLSIY